MRKGFKYKLKEGIEQLPAYEPNEKMWGIIEQALHVDEEISDQLSQLPVYDVDPDSWVQISNSLGDKKKRININRIVQIAAASTLILAVSISLLYRPDNGIRIETELVINENSSGLRSGSDSEDPIKVIEALCSSGAPVCSTEAFVKKMNLYTELSMELNDLKTVIDNIGESPEIIHSIIRIENLKSNTFQELILLIHS